MLAAIKLGFCFFFKERTLYKTDSTPPLQNNIYTSSEAPHMHTSMPKRDTKYNQFKCHGSW